jgi:hypothetical protein
MLVFGAMIAACSNKPDVRTLEPYRDEMCACKDAVCANSVLDRWADALLKFNDVSEADDKRIMTISVALNTCRERVIVEGTGLKRTQ